MHASQLELIPVVFLFTGTTGTSLTMLLRGGTLQRDRICATFREPRQPTVPSSTQTTVCLCTSVSWSCSGTQPLLSCSTNHLVLRTTVDTTFRVMSCFWCLPQRSNCSVLRNW